MKKIVFCTVLILIFAFVSISYAQDATMKNFEQGNEAYQSGNYLKSNRIL
jgi:hypothetical protein